MGPNVIHFSCDLTPIIKPHSSSFMPGDYKQLLDKVFCDIQNNQGRGRGYQPKPKAEADNPYRDLDYSGYHKNRI